MPRPAEDVARAARTCWPQITGEPRLVMLRENAVFRVDTTGGPAALRVHRAGYHNRNTIASELAWMAMLARNGLEVPTPLETRDGGLLVEVDGGDDGNNIVDLLAWLDGEPLGRSGAKFSHDGEALERVFSAIGLEMASLHLFSDAWQLPAQFERPAWDVDGLVGEAPRWGRFWESPALSREEAILLTQARRHCQGRLAELVAAGTDYGLIHADLVRENILVAEGRPRFIDFDDSGFGFRLFDIATALVKNRAEPRFETIKAALLAGYRSKRALDDDALDLFMALRVFTYLGWAGARAGEPGMAERIGRMKEDAVAAARVILQRV